MSRNESGLRFRRFEVSSRYGCNACGKPGDRFMFDYNTRWFTGEVWCADCWQRAQTALAAAGLCDCMATPVEHS